MNMTFLKGSDGKISMMRVSIFMIIVPIMAIFAVHNIISMISGNGFISLGMEEITLISTALGTKAVQSFAESKSSSNKDLPTDKTE